MLPNNWLSSKARFFLVVILGSFLLIVFTFHDFKTVAEKKVEPVPEPPTSPSDVVLISDLSPDIQISLAYASDSNIFNTRIYDINEAYLRRGTAEKLSRAQKDFISSGYSLKIWDAYRPPEAQFKLWEVLPDSRYVVNPYQGFSNHSKGVAVDVTLVELTGQELPMPSGFDDFSPLSNRDYSDVNAEQAANAQLLESIMVKNGFESIFSEWWHFADTDKDQSEVINLSDVAKLNH